VDSLCKKGGSSVQYVLEPRTFPLGRPDSRMSADVISKKKYINLRKTRIWKRERGLAEPVGRALPRRGEAGGRIPSFPQTAWRPSHPPAGGQWRGEAPNL